VFHIGGQKVEKPAGPWMHLCNGASVRHLLCGDGQQYGDHMSRLI